MTVTAKVKLTRKTEYPRPNPAGEPEVDQVALEFQADYADGRNAEWARYTPALSITMTVRPEVAEQFSTGAAYTLTFEPEA